MLSKPLNTIDAFAGIGGFALGLRDFAVPVAYIEWEQDAQKLLKNAQSRGDLEKATIYGDVCGCTRETMGLRSAQVDMITGGFPCQDVSLMGKQAGLASKRSGLFYQLVRLADELKPTFMFLENVSALVKHLPKVLGELHQRGYDSRWTTLSAGNMGAPHYRNRVFILACRRGAAPGVCASRLPPARRSDVRFVSDKRKFSVFNGDAASCSSPSSLQPAAKRTPSSRRFARFFASTVKVPQCKRVGKGRTAQKKMLNAWRKPSTQPRMVKCKGAGDSGWKQRCQALGNSVVPVCARAAFMHLLLGDSGRVELPRLESGATTKQEVDALARWMENSETAMATAVKEGLQNVWLDSAEAARDATKGATGKRPGQGGVMLDGVITELVPLTSALPQFKNGAPSLPDGGVILAGNGRKSRSVLQTTALVKRQTIARLATPRFGGWGISKVLTARSKDDLITQLAFASDQPGSGTEALLREGCPNPDFIEHMMGYPAGWTKP